MSIPSCLVEVWIASPEGGTADATREAIEGFGGTYFGPSPAAFPSQHLVPVGRLQELAADPRVGKLEVFAATGASGPGFSTDYLYKIVLALGDGHRFQAQLGIDSERITHDLDFEKLSHLGKRQHLSKDSGAFWVLEPSNPEVFVKILDGCALNDHYWLFVSGLTDLGTILQVTDFGSERSRVLRTADGEPFPSVFDDEAFPCTDNL